MRLLLLPYKIKTRLKIQYSRCLLWIASFRDIRSLLKQFVWLVVKEILLKQPLEIKTRRFHVIRQNCSPGAGVGGGGGCRFEWGCKMCFRKRLKSETDYAPKVVKNQALWFRTYIYIHHKDPPRHSLNSNRCELIGRKWLLRYTSHYTESRIELKLALQHQFMRRYVNSQKQKISTSKNRQFFDLANSNQTQQQMFLP